MLAGTSETLMVLYNVKHEAEVAQDTGRVQDVLEMFEPLMQFNAFVKHELEVMDKARRWSEEKQRKPKFLLLFKTGYMYEAWQEDAAVMAEDLKLTLYFHEREFKWCQFPVEQLDEMLPRLIRKGHRICIYDF